MEILLGINHYKKVDSRMNKIFCGFSIMDSLISLTFQHSPQYFTKIVPIKFLFLLATCPIMGSLTSFSSYFWTRETKNKKKKTLMNPWSNPSLLLNFLHTDRNVRKIKLIPIKNVSRILLLKSKMENLLGWRGSRCDEPVTLRPPLNFSSILQVFTSLSEQLRRS